MGKNAKRRRQAGHMGVVYGLVSQAEASGQHGLCDEAVLSADLDVGRVTLLICVHAPDKPFVSIAPRSQGIDESEVAMAVSLAEPAIAQLQTRARELGGKRRARKGEGRSRGT